MSLAWMNLSNYDEPNVTTVIIRRTLAYRVNLSPHHARYHYDSCHAVNEIISRHVMKHTVSRYLPGTPVKGHLSMEFSWVPSANPYQILCPRTYRIKQRIDGCYNFSVMTADFARTLDSCNMLNIHANVRDDRNGISRSQLHNGPIESHGPLNIRLGDDTNGFFRPGLPYFGKVIVTKLDGTPASWETIVVRANSRDDRRKFSRTYTTDESGEVKFAFCVVLTEVASMRIEAQSTRFNIPRSSNEDWNWKNRNVYTSSRSNVRYLRQWFSPTSNYVQLKKPDSPISCGQWAHITVSFTTSVGLMERFYYQVMAQGKVVEKGRSIPSRYRGPGFGNVLPLPGMCLLEIEAASHREARDDCITDKVKKRDNGEPVARSASISDNLFSFLLSVKIMPIMSPKFTVLVYSLMEDREVVAGSMQFDVETCLENKWEHCVGDEERALLMFPPAVPAVMVT
ncbi:alpha-2-macroglobulin-like protein [Plakobranchus ocellatus]|uniref:Alpha-2-macroglobulin-like protein n=1 Tax=Plakobranchus ocellatus TaxID=259542 RepID=A0AAV4CWK1_9GAST|nr:alpha-2-macroglobulin-like protein [Plakobranchus ocellatus]